MGCAAKPNSAKMSSDAVGAAVAATARDALRGCNSGGGAETGARGTGTGDADTTI